jgi:hypothetical protein
MAFIFNPVKALDELTIFNLNNRIYHLQPKVAKVQPMIGGCICQAAYDGYILSWRCHYDIW